MLTYADGAVDTGQKQPGPEIKMTSSIGGAGRRSAAIHAAAVAARRLTQSLVLGKVDGFLR